MHIMRSFLTLTAALLLLHLSVIRLASSLIHFSRSSVVRTNKDCCSRLKSPPLFAGKGFGSSATQKSTAKEGTGKIFKSTLPGAFKPVLGDYAKALAAQSRQFDDITADAAVDSELFDMYARMQGDSCCWFIGKLCFAKERISQQEAFQSMRPLLIEYAKSLRPKELAAAAGQRRIELWYAPGNTELSVARNMIPLQPCTESTTAATAAATTDTTTTAATAAASAATAVDTDTAAAVEGEARSFHALPAGAAAAFQAEVYHDEEDGFRCERDALGQPLKAPFQLRIEDPSFLTQQ